jgi:hypothetical protein
MHLTRLRRFTLPLALPVPYGSPRSGYGAFATYQSPLHCSCFSPADAMTATIIILAGPNGAGKTTFARSFLPQEANCLRFINADLITAGLSPFAPEAAALKAGRLMLRESRVACSAGRVSPSKPHWLAWAIWLGFGSGAPWATRSASKF